MISKGQSNFLNLTRWLAAGLVVLEHARNLFFRDYGNLESSNGFQKLFYFVTGFGHESVVVFFVISGFLVGGKTWDRWRDGQFHWRKYLADRISRLYAVLFAALLIGGCLDWIGGHYFNSTGYYTNEVSEPIAVINGSFVDRLSAKNLAGNLLMLQEVEVPTFGSNGPLWSLAHEWWYYLMFPLTLTVMKGSCRARVGAAALLLAIISFLTPYILVLFGIWMIGVFGWWLNGKARIPFWVAFPLFLTGLLGMRLELMNEWPFAHHFVLGVGFAVLLNSFANQNHFRVAGKLSKSLADFSYSVYLIHFPVLVISISAFLSFTGSPERLNCTPFNLGWFLVFVLFSVGCAYVVSCVTEQRTQLVRHYLYRLFRVT